MLRMMRNYNTYFLERSFVIVLVFMLFLSPSVILFSETNTSAIVVGLNDCEEPYHDTDTVITTLNNNVVTEGSRSSRNTIPFVDVVVKPNPIIFKSAGKIWINFTFEEYNGYNLIVTSNSFQFFTVQNERINSSWSALFSNIQVPAGANATWAYNYNVRSDLLLSLKQQGVYKLFLNASFKGKDSANNEYEINVRVPVFLELTVAVIVERSIYMSLISKLHRYYEDVNTKIKVEFIERNGTWSSPVALRNYIITLWQIYNMSGAILIGYFPLPMWEIIHDQNNIEKCPIPIFYEDLDGSFGDIDTNGYYDRHYWGLNDGPEIWVSFIMPPIRGQTIPSTHLDPQGLGVGGGLTGHYYEDNSLTVYNGSRIDPVIDFDWEDESLYNNIYPDNFSIRWTGEIKIDKNDTYRFFTEAKGGVKLWIDDMVVIDHAFDYTDYMYQNMGGKYLTKGWHKIKVEYNENGKGPDEYGMLRLSWSSTMLNIEPFKAFFDKTHLYHTNKLGQPDNALLFMDYCYGMMCKMKEPIKDRLLDPIYAEHTIVGGCQNNTNASEYMELLKTGYEIVSVWSHAGSDYHWIKPQDDPNAVSSAPFWKIRKRPAGVLTFIWGCHAGDVMAGGNFERALSKNLVANYAFNTGYGLAAVGCTRSYGTTFRETYFALQNESYLGLGYFYFKDYCYNKTLVIKTVANMGKDKWIDDEILMGDPFITLNHRTTDLKLTIENNKKWINYTNVNLKITCTNSQKDTNEMSFRILDGSWTSWEPYSPSKFWQLTSGTGGKSLEVRMRNSFGYSYNNAYDVIGIDTEPPKIVSLTINDGSLVTKNMTIKVELDAVDDLSGPHWISFSLDGQSWSNLIKYSPVVFFNLTGENGLKTVYVKVLDGACNQGKYVVKQIRLETTEIYTMAKITGTPGENDWYVSPISIEMSFEQECSIYDSIFYRVNGAGWVEYSTPIELDESGYYAIEYYGSDIYGFKESINNCTLKLDLNSPTDLVVEIENGRTITNSTEISLKITAIDDLSGCWLLRVSEDNKNWCEWLNYTTFVKYTYSPENFEGYRTIYVQVKDRAGNIINNPGKDDIYFDCVHPTIVYATPVNSETNVGIESNIIIEFSEEIQFESINEHNIYMIDSERCFIHGTYTCTLDNRSGNFILVFTPDSALEYYTQYTLIIEPNLMDLAGNLLIEREIYNFTTLGLAPGPVQEFKVRSGENEVYVTWKPPIDSGSGQVLGYKIYRGENSSVLEYICEDSGNDLKYIDGQIGLGNTYFYSVSAYNFIGDGPLCEYESVYVPEKSTLPVFDEKDDEQEKMKNDLFENTDQDKELENIKTDTPIDQNFKDDNGAPNLLSWLLGIVVIVIILVIILCILLRPKNMRYIESTMNREDQDHRPELIPDQITNLATVPVQYNQTFELNNNQHQNGVGEGSADHENEVDEPFLTDYQRWCKARKI